MPFVNGLQVTNDGRGLVSEAAVGLLFEASLQASLTPELSGGSPTPTYSRASIATVLAYEAYAAQPVDERFTYSNGPLSTRPGNPWTLRKTGSPECEVSSQRLTVNISGPAGRAFYWPTAWPAGSVQYSQATMVAAGDNIGVAVNLQGATGATLTGYYAKLPGFEGGQVSLCYINNGAINVVFTSTIDLRSGDTFGLSYDPAKPNFVSLFKNGVINSAYDFSTDAPGLPQGGNPGIGGATASGNFGLIDLVKVQPNLPGDGPDQLKLITVQTNEPRFVGARRISTGNWSANFSNGLPITTENGGDSSVCDDLGPFGYLAEASGTNSLLQSNNFLAPNWNVFGAPVITPNAGVAPDGTNTAWLIEVTAGATGYTWFSQSVSQLANATISCFFKAGVSSKVSIGIGNAGEDICEFDLSTESVVLGANAARGSITPVGNGWYRCSATRKDLPSIDPFYIGLFQASGQPESFYMWGAQAETNVNRTVSSYIATTTVAVTRGPDNLSYAAAGNIDNAVGSMRVDNLCPPTQAIETIGLVNGGNNRGMLHGNDGSYYFNDSAGSYNQAVGIPLNQMNVLKAAWSGTERKLQLGEGVINSKPFSGDLGFPTTISVGGPPAQGSAFIIRLLKIAGEDLSARSVTATPLAIEESDTFLTGRRYAAADSALRVLDEDGGAVGDVHVAGWRYNEAGELYVFVTDSVAPTSRVFINGLLTTHDGALCINKTKPIVGHVHGWPVADDGSLCVTTTASLISAFDDAFSDAFG